MTWVSTAKGITRWAFGSIAWLGGYCLWTKYLGNRQTARILCYHGINPSPRNLYAVSADDFAAQMRLLAEHHTILSMDHLIHLLREGRPLPPNAVAVTIDDGFQDAYTHAYPILKELAIPATLFLPVGLIGTGSPVPIRNPLPQTEFLSWEQVREMSRNGICFGSHSLTHTSLTHLSLQETEYQLKKSRTRLEDETGRQVTGLAYPYGTFRDMSIAIQDLVTAAGYSWAVSAISGTNHHKTNLLALRRSKVERWDGMFMFTKILSGALDPWFVLQAASGKLHQATQSIGSLPRPEL